MINPTAHRVSWNTPARFNRQITLATDARIAWYAAHPDQIDTRLKELEKEWDFERTLEAEAPVMTLPGLLLGLTVSRKFLVVPLFAQGMVLLHALQGWYPLLPLFRGAGVRTQSEIARERYALKALRGDFRAARDIRQSPERANQLLDATGV
jgi:hypothetical protein